jgi:hypothetical protein
MPSLPSTVFCLYSADPFAADPFAADPFGAPALEDQPAFSDIIRSPENTNNRRPP